MLSYLGGMSQTLASVSVMHMLMFLLAVFHERGCVQQCFGNQRSPVASRCIVFSWNLDKKVPVSRQFSGTKVTNQSYFMSLYHVEGRVATVWDYTGGLKKTVAD